MRVFTDKENGMPLYNVELALKCTMVVQAEDCDDARDIAYANWKEAIDDADARPMIHVTGDVTQERHLRDGWDGQCVPYGGDGNTRISTLLKHNAGHERPGKAQL
jgi:hypothetical protein